MHLALVEKLTYHNSKQALFTTIVKSISQGSVLCPLLFLTYINDLTLLLLSAGFKLGHVLRLVKAWVTT